MVAPTPKETLDALFPIPTVPRAVDNVKPAYSPGFSTDSAETLVRLVKENHERFHIFFNDRGFHNHCTHHLYAIYTLGAPSKVLDAAFESHAVYMKDAMEPPGEITDSNWTEHFGEDSYFRAYVAFFTKSLMRVGTDALLDKYVFSTSANWSDSIKNDGEQPQMLNRMLSGVLHPLIHIGYGIEFNSPGMIVEGLAMACAQRGPDFNVLVLKSFFSGDSLTSRLASALTISGKPSVVHSFSIVAEMLKDPELGPGKACKNPTAMAIDPRAQGEIHGNPFPMSEVLDKRGELIQKYADKWTVNAEDKAEMKSKVDELSFLVTLLYGVAGQEDGKDFVADFFTMHLVTSSLFLPAFLEHLTPSAQSSLLRSYLSIALSVWVARGRPTISIANFYARTSPKLTPPGPMPTPGKETLAPDALTPNPWFPLLQSTVLHPNEHLPKLQRALAHYAQEYGNLPAGTWKDTELEGAEILDGTVFVRAAALTMNRLGWLREGQEKRAWDFVGFWN